MPPRKKTIMTKFKILQESIKKAGHAPLTAKDNYGRKMLALQAENTKLKNRVLNVEKGLKAVEDALNTLDGFFDNLIKSDSPPEEESKEE